MVFTSVMRLVAGNDWLVIVTGGGVARWTSRAGERGRDRGGQQQ